MCTICICGAPRIAEFVLSNWWMYFPKYVCNKPDNSQGSSSAMQFMSWTNQGFMLKVRQTLPWIKKKLWSYKLWTSVWCIHRLIGTETNYPFSYSWCRAPGCDIWQVQRSARCCCWWRDPLPHSLGSETYHLWLSLPSTQRACHHRQQRYINYLLNSCNVPLTFAHTHSVSLKTQLAIRVLWGYSKPLGNAVVLSCREK